MAASGTGSLVFIDDVTADGSSRRSSAALWGFWEAVRKEPANCYRKNLLKIVAHVKERIFIPDVLDSSPG